ncbi:MAG: IS630 family transposase [Anaerolineae bacterium]
MNPRIQLTRPTVKALQQRLQQAYAQADVRLVRRTSALLEHLEQHLPVRLLRVRWDLHESTFYGWIHDFLLNGLDSLAYAHRGGRPAKLTKSQKQQLCAWVDAGPQACGFESGCWSTLLLQELIRREFQVLYSRYYLCELLRNLGYSFQKAQFVSDHLDPVRRAAWCTQEWPQIVREAQRRHAWLLFGDEASFPQWGSLSYTWARRNHPPQVKTAGKRKAYKVFGLIDLFSGRLFYQGIEGKFNSESYQAFLLSVLGQTRKPIFLLQDGAKYHTSKATRAFFAQHAARLTVYQLPSYSPDYNPIESLWKKLKKRATHNKYFEQFAAVIESVEKALSYFAEQPGEVLSVMGQYLDETGLPRQLAPNL